MRTITLKEWDGIFAWFFDSGEIYSRGDEVCPFFLTAKEAQDWMDDSTVVEITPP